MSDDKARRPRVAIIGAQVDGHDVGESWCGYQWISRIAERCDVTLLTLRFPEHIPPSSQITGARVIEWDAFPYLSRWPRLNSSIKPWYVHFYLKARAWLKKAEKQGEQFDLLHHLTPMAMRYPSPCAGLATPYIIGPVAGGLPTPPGFVSELGTEPVFAKLRSLDAFRLRRDPLMRRTYQTAEAVICSGPYARDALAHLHIKRVVLDTEVGFDELAPPRPERSTSGKNLKLLYVGRIVRTKGLRECIRALAQLSDLPSLTLDVAGDGEDLNACKQEATALGVTDCVNFLGRVPHDEVDKLYEAADIFVFPSFREPTGIVLFEAMRNGLPIVTTNVGGPGHIVDDTCGIRLKAIEPEQLAADLAGAIRSLAKHPERLITMRKGARQRATEIGLWGPKIDRLAKLYDEVLGEAQNE